MMKVLTKMRDHAVFFCTSPWPTTSLLGSG